MMEVLKNDTKIDFVKLFQYFGPLSALLVLFFLFRILSGALNYGVDFRGGAEVQVKFNQKVDLSELRSGLDAKGFSGASVQSIGSLDENEFLIKVKAQEENLNQVSASISELLTTSFQEKGAEIRKTDIVGPKAGDELRTSAFLAIAYAVLAIMIYLALRFDFKYAPGAAIALFHDAIMTVGVLSLTGFEFNLQVVAAVLAIIGYSVNDTVVIYDRIRENEQKRAGLSFREHINEAINSTMSRTILTSSTTVLVSLVMFFFGGESIKGFFFCMTIGILFGTYSTIYIASPLTLLLDNLRRRSEGLRAQKA